MSGLRSGSVMGLQPRRLRLSSTIKLIKMKVFELKGTERKTLGRRESRKARKAEQIPCVLYGNGIDNVHFIVGEKDLQHLIYTPESYLVNLDVDGRKYDAVLQALQFHPVTDKIEHIDFMNIVEDKPLTVELPVVITGSSEGVKQGGKLQVLIRKLKVSGMLNDIPENLPIEVTGLSLGKTIFVKDLSYPNLKILNPESSTVCRIKMTRAAREQQTESGKK